MVDDNSSDGYIVPYKDGEIRPSADGMGYFESVDSRLYFRPYKTKAGVASAAPTKNDQGKLRYDLIPVDAYAEVVRSMTLGAEKYADHNYLKGFAWHRPYAAAQRHMNQFWAGERIDVDPDTGKEQHHLAAAIANLLMLMVHDLRSLGNDDRVIIQKDRK